MRRALIALVAVAAALAFAAPASAIVAKNGVVFNSVPDTLPGNVPSVGFQATQASEFGDGIKFTPSPKKHLKTVSVVMSVWACGSGQWNLGTCTTTPGATFTHPITLNLYRTDSGGQPGSLIVSQTRTFRFTFRPSTDTANCGTGATGWYSASDDACYNGFAQKIVFNLANRHLVLPNSIVYGIAFNTSGYGDSPYGYTTPCALDAMTGCPYDALNVGAAAGVPKRGFDRYPDGTFYDSQTPSQYCDGGAGGVGTFRLDDGCWTGFNPLVRFLFSA
jgi:hypothetical protein